MKACSLDKILNFDPSTIGKINPKYNQPVDLKENSLQIGISNYLSKQHRQRTMKVHENKIKIKNKFLLSNNINII